MTSSSSSSADFLPTLYYQRLSEYAIIPKRATPGSIGTDLFAPVDMVAVPKNITCIPVDLLLVPSPGYYLRIASKSGLAVKHNLTVEAGVLDPDYRGNVVVVIRNHSKQPHLFKRGEPIAQVIQEKAVQPVLVEAPILDNTIRGTGGFGSTTTG